MLIFFYPKKKINSRYNLNYLKLSEVAIEQHFPPTEVVMNKNKNEREVLEKITTTKVNRNVAETSSNDDNDESFAPDVVSLMSDEIKDGVFLEQVKTVISILRKELGDKHKTPMKHFCAYICWRLETREGIGYNPTNTKQKVNEIANLKAYRHWFLKKVGLPQNIYDLMIKGGYGKHWRTSCRIHWRKRQRRKSLIHFKCFLHG